MLVSTFEVLLKPQFPKVIPVPEAPAFAALSRTVIQGYFLTIANVNAFDVTLSLVFTIKFPEDGSGERPTSFQDFVDAIDITGQNLFDLQIVAEPAPNANKAQVIFTIPSEATSLFILQPNFIKNQDFLVDANFEARGYVEIFRHFPPLPFIQKPATLLVTPQQRGTFFKDLAAPDFANIGLDQVAYDLPVSNGGVFNLPAITVGRT